jgi:hypothetical protein
MTRQSRREEQMIRKNGAKTVAGRSRDGRFAAGNRGRPRGARNRTTVLAEELLDGEAEEIIRKVIKKAKQGDMIALRLCLDRLVPPRRDRPVNFTLPAMNSAGDASKVMTAITMAVGSGELAPNEAAELSRVVHGYVRTLEITEIERRLRILEERATRDA